MLTPLLECLGTAPSVSSTDMLSDQKLGLSRLTQERRRCDMGWLYELDLRAGGIRRLDQVT